LVHSIFTVLTVAIMPIYTFMIGYPKLPFTQRLVRSKLPLIFFGLMHAALLAIFAFSHPQKIFAAMGGLSTLTGFVELLRSEPMIVAIAWANLLSLDYCLAREVYLEGQELGIPTRHSLVLCCMFGPTGLLLHLFTKAVWLKWAQAPKAPLRQAH